MLKSLSLTFTLLAATCLAQPAPVDLKARAQFTYATVSAIAADMSVPGWNCSFISDAPWMDFDPTCSMPVM
jgi:hypothetical protein